MDISPAQIRAARGLVDWSQTRLAVASNISENTVRSFERGHRMPVRQNLAAMRAALEEVGVLFLMEQEQVSGGIGVRLRLPDPVLAGEPEDRPQALWITLPLAYRGKTYTGVALYDALEALGGADAARGDTFRLHQDAIISLFLDKIDAGNTEDLRVFLRLEDVGGLQRA